MGGMLILCRLMGGSTLLLYIYMRQMSTSVKAKMAHRQFLSEDHREKTSFVDTQNLKVDATRHCHKDLLQTTNITI